VLGFNGGEQVVAMMCSAMMYNYMVKHIKETYHE
jgi:hypothetical protein